MISRKPKGKTRIGDTHTAYKCNFVADYENIEDILAKIDCDQCIDAEVYHITCPHCLYHGEPEEYGEGISCSKCDWGHAT